MRICTSSAQDKSTRILVDELRFSVRQLNEAIVYAVEHPQQNVIVEIYTLEKPQECPKIMKLTELLTDTPNLYYSFCSLSDLVQYAKTTGDTRIMYQYPVNTWGLIQILMYYKCAYVTVGEPLVFEMEKLRKNVVSKGIKLRVAPNVARAEIAKEVGEGIEHFFILPQHMPIYEEYIDIIDLLDPNPLRELALVKVYQAKIPYILSLDSLITNVDVHYPATLFDTSYARRRMNCGQTCMEGPNACHYCSSYLKMLAVTKPST